MKKSDIIGLVVTFGSMAAAVVVPLIFDRKRKNKLKAVEEANKKKYTDEKIHEKILDYSFKKDMLAKEENQKDLMNDLSYYDDKMIANFKDQEKFDAAYLKFNDICNGLEEAAEKGTGDPYVEAVTKSVNEAKDKESQEELRARVSADEQNRRWNDYRKLNRICSTFDTALRNIAYHSGNSYYYTVGNDIFKALTEATKTE